MRRRAIWIAVGVALIVALLYLPSSSIGREFLRADLEARLSELLQGEVRIGEATLSLLDGLGVVGRRVSVYPTSAGPGLYAEEVTVELSVAALLLGRFHLSTLVLEEFRIRLELDSDGRWSFPPLQWLGDRKTEGRATDLPFAEFSGGLEAISRAVLQRVRIADVVSIRSGTVVFDDRRTDLGAGANAEADPDGPDAAPGGRPRLHFRLEGLRGNLARPSRSEDAQLGITGLLVDARGDEVPIVIEGESLSGQQVALSLTVTGLDFDAVDPYVADIAGELDLDGRVSGALRFSSAELGTQHLELEVSLDELDSTVWIDDRPISIALAFNRLLAVAEISPDELRVQRIEATGPHFAVSIDAAITRPITQHSETRASIAVRGLDLETANAVIAQLPPEDRALLDLWFAPIQSAQLDHVRIRGEAPLAQWSALADGELQQLPEGFTLSFAASQVELALGERDRISDGSFEATWSGDEFHLWNIRGSWQGDPLPRLEARVTGLSHFLDIDEPTIAVDAPRLAALASVGELLWPEQSPEEREREDRETENREPEAGEPEARDPDEVRQALAVPAIDVELDFVRHPLLRWPLTDGLVKVRPAPAGVRATFSAASWGGVPITGEFLYQQQPDPSVSLRIEAQPGQPDGRESERPDAAPETAIAPYRMHGEPPVLLRGRFTLSPVEEGAERRSERGMLTHLSGELALRSAVLSVTQGQASVTAGSSASGRIELDLGTAQQLGVELSGQIDEAQVDALGAAIGLGRDFATGTVDVLASLRGIVVPGRGEPLAQLVGIVSLAARDGEIRREIPTVVAIAAATDGFNPFANNDSLAYDTVEANLILDHGRIEATHFEIDGPIRVYAQGTLDFAREPQQIDAVVGVFLFQRARKLLTMVPLVKLVIPGSERGMVGAYFGVTGNWDAPEVTTLKMKSFQEQLPDVLTKPFEFLDSWLGGEDESPGSGERQ